MYYSVSDVSSQLKISKQAVYKKINKLNELKQHIKQLKTGLVISEEGVVILRQSLQENQHFKPIKDKFNKDGEKDDFDNNPMVYQQLFETLTKQLEIKDKQIEMLTRLNENSQILLKQQQDKILLLENNEIKKRLFWNFFKR